MRLAGPILSKAAGIVLASAPLAVDAANRHWLPPVQISHEDASAMVSNVRRGTLTRSLHATIGSQSPIGNCNINNRAPDYLALTLDTTDWPSAWAAAWSSRERFEWDNPDVYGGWFAPDVRFLLDDADSAHMTWETHQIHLNSVAYKQRRSGWAGIPPAYSDQAPDSVSYFDDAWHLGGSPNLFIEAVGAPGTADDVVHVIFKAGGSIWHRAKVIGGSWGPGRVVTDSCLGVGQSPAFVVTADDRLHMMGTCIIGETAATVRHLAFALVPGSPDSVWVEVADDSLDSYTVNPNPNEPLEDLSEALEMNVAALGGVGSETLHIVYHVDSSSVDFQREIMYRRYTVATGVWSQRYVVTPPDGSRSMYPELFVEPGGARHVMYVDGNRRRWERYFDREEVIELCNHGTTDPEAYSATLLRNELRYIRAASDAVWSLPEPFTADMRTAFDGPKFIADGDTVWVVFNSHDDDDLATSGQWYDGNVETWFRKGIPMPQTTIASGESLHWNGEIYLDRDFVVQAGGRLIIDAGTAVVAASLADSANAGGSGGTAGRVEILVEGQLEVRGTEQRPVKFRSVEQDEGDWGGVIFLNGAAAGSIMDHTSIRDATEGIRVAAAEAPALGGVTFARNQNADIFLTRDVTIPFGSDWDLPGTSNLAVAYPPAADSPGGHSGLSDLLVAGSLRVVAPSSAPGAFGSPGGGVWGGVRFLAGSDAAESGLEYVVVEGARDGVRIETADAPLLRGNVFSGSANADVLLTRDVRVLAGTEWLLTPGTVVVAADPPGGEDAGGTSGACDLIVAGDLRAEGSVSDLVVFTVEGGSGEWGGLVFDQAAVLSELGQWSGEYTTHSLLQSVRIENAVSGVRVVNTGAPALQAVEFQSIAGDQHIVLDGSDVYVPFDGGWTLGRGTRVKARPHQSGKPEIGGRNPGLVDLVVHGPLVTLGVQGDSVHFEPDGATPTSLLLGQAWGGAFVDWMSTGGSIEYTDIGYAPVPLALFLQNSTVRNSRLHHFRDQGLQVLGSWTLNGGPQVLDNLIERGAGLDGSVGRDGIYVMQVSAANINGNTVVIDPGAQALGGGAGIRITAGYTYCGGVSGAYTLYVDENTVTGPGGDHDPPTHGKWSGIHGDWMCGSDTRDIFVRDNLIEGWNGAGITLLQTKDVQFTCNEVRDCFDGVDFSRNTDVTGPPARFRGNVLQTITDDTDRNQDVARTDNAVKLALGPITADKGANHLVSGGQDWFVRENDEEPTAVLDARASLWIRNGIPYTAATAIDDYFTKDSTDVSDAVRVDIGTPLDPEMLPDVCGSSGSATKPLPGETALQDDATRHGQGLPDAAVAELPERTELAVIRSTRGRVDVRVALSGRQSRGVDVEVFNVAGRRVRILMKEQLPGGRYGVSWSGDADDGAHVTAGVYLVRMRAGDEVRVRKAVLVR